jgi:hypothetical protein
LSLDDGIEITFNRVHRPLCKIPADNKRSLQSFVPRTNGYSNTQVSPHNQQLKITNKRFCGPVKDRASSHHTMENPSKKVSSQASLDMHHLKVCESRFKALMNRSALSQDAMELLVHQDLNMLRLRKRMLQTSQSRYILQRIFSGNILGAFTDAKGNAVFKP